MGLEEGCQGCQDPLSFMDALRVRGRPGVDIQAYLATVLKICCHNLQQGAGVSAGYTILADHDGKPGPDNGADEFSGGSGVQAHRGPDHSLA